MTHQDWLHLLLGPLTMLMCTRAQADGPHVFQLQVASATAVTAQTGMRMRLKTVLRWRLAKFCQ